MIKAKEGYFITIKWSICQKDKTVSICFIRKFQNCLAEINEDIDNPRIMLEKFLLSATKNF